VHLWQIKRHTVFVFTAEFQQFFLHFGIVEPGIGPGFFGVFQTYSGIVVQVIIIAETVRIQDLIHHFASVTTKNLVVNLQSPVFAFFMAVKTNRSGFGNITGLEKS
jgi:hypothetical protein